MKGPLAKWLPAVAPGAVLTLMGIQVLLGLRGFGHPNGGVLGLLQTPGVLLGWGSVALLLPILVWLLLGWWGYGLTGLALKAMGSVALGVAAGALVGLGAGAAGGGTIGGALAVLLQDTLGTILSSVILLTMAAPGLLLATARFSLPEAPAAALRRTNPVATASPVPTLATPWYPKPRFDPDGNELPMEFGRSNDVGSIRYREPSPTDPPPLSDSPSPATPSPATPSAALAVSSAPTAVRAPRRDEEGEVPTVASILAGSREGGSREGGSREGGSREGGSSEPVAPPVEDKTEKKRRLPRGVRYADEPPEPAPPPDESSPFLEKGAAPARAETPPPEAVPKAPVATPPEEPADEEDASREPRTAKEWLEGATAAARNGRGASAENAPSLSESVSRAMEPLGREESSARYRDKLAASGMFDGVVPYSEGKAQKKPAEAEAPAAGASAPPEATKPVKRSKAPRVKKTAGPPAPEARPEPVAAPASPVARAPEKAGKKPSKPSAKPSKASVGAPVAAAAPAPAHGDQGTRNQGMLGLRPSPKPAASGPLWLTDRSDPLFVKAVEAALDRGAASPVLLTRRLGIGYARAKTLMDRMVETGVLGEVMASGARPTSISREDWDRPS